MHPSKLKMAEGRAAWLAARRAGIGSSDTAAIAGLSPWKTPLHVYLDKTGELADTDSAPKRWGRLLEDVVACAYEEETGRRACLPPEAIHVHPRFPWMLASLDRVAWVEGEPRVVELKNVGHHSQEWGTPGTDEVPDYYYLQVQHQLAVTGMPGADLAALFGGQRLDVYEVRRNEETIRQLIELGADFWGRVERREPPEPQWGHPATLALVKSLYGVSEGQSIELGDDARELARAYASATASIGDARSIQDRCKALLLDMMGHAALATLPDGTRLTRRVVKRKGYEVQPCEYVDFRIRATKE